jgi:ferredoxin
MIVSKQKPLQEILSSLQGCATVFLIGCTKCATVCKSGGEEEVWQMQEALMGAGIGVSGSIVIDEACHMLRVSRDLRSKQQLVDEADALVVLACGAGMQSVSAASSTKTVAALNTLFLGNIRRFGQFEQKCSLCGECILTETAGICPVTTCAKGLLNGPCGGMDNGRCETDQETPCAWAEIYERLHHQPDSSSLAAYRPPKNFEKSSKPGKLKLPK